MSTEPRERPSREATARRRLLAWAIALMVLTGLSLLWSLTPAGEWLRPIRLLEMLEAFGGHPSAPWIILAGFVVGGLIALPVTVMVVLAAATFGPVSGFLVGLGGATLSACTSFAIGRLLGHRQVTTLAGSRVHAVSLKLRAGGVTAIAALRMMPVTHFTIVSLVAGVSHIRLRDFIAGTMIGMAPGVGAIALFLEQLSAATREPSLQHTAWLTLVSLGILAVLLALRRVAARRRRNNTR